MINYTDRICQLMADIVVRVPTLSFLNMSRVLVFARAGRSDAEGPYATCHCVSLPPSEPGYYYWRDRRTGALTRRSEWFITKSPSVTLEGAPIDYMVSFSLPRFCDQSASANVRKQAHYGGYPSWITKLDTIVHELYHVDPERPGIRRMERADGTCSANCHGQRFFEDVVEMVKLYLGTNPDPHLYEFLKYDFAELMQRYGGVAGTAFRAFPSYPQRYSEVLNPQPLAVADDCRVEPLKPPRIATTFTERDLTLREFLPHTSRLLVRESDVRAA